jgi:hypothetical protein
MVELDEVSFGILDHCPYYVRTALNGSADRAVFDKYKEVAADLSTKTGVPIHDLDRLEKVVDGIVSRSQFTEFLPLPKWANNPQYIEHISDLNNQFHREYIPILMPETGGKEEAFSSNFC